MQDADLWGMEVSRVKEKENKEKEIPKGNSRHFSGSWNESEQVVFYACGRWCSRGCLSNRGPRPIPDRTPCVYNQ